MGQYYMAYVENEGRAKVFCPQNAIFMTRNNLGPNDKMKHTYDEDDPNCWGSCFSGLKLMEHSWLENDFVNGVLESIWDNPARVAWVGDYADDEFDFNEYYTKNVYDHAWGEEGRLPELPFDKVPEIHRSGFIVNLDKGAYIDLKRYAEVAGFTTKWDKGNTWTIHPLPLLTCIGNGRGGGDYHGKCMGMVGSWAMDRISFTRERPTGFKEIDYSEITFVEE